MNQENIHSEKQRLFFCKNYFFSLHRFGFQFRVKLNYFFLSKARLYFFIQVIIY